ncbi:MAG: ABC-three component system protein [Ferruginibacter sp.]
MIVNMALKLEDIIIQPSNSVYNDTVRNGPTILPQKIIASYENKEWELFIEECTQNLKTLYQDVKRTGGAGDMGIDIAGFKTAKDFKGNWDNYQCKHYDHALYPSDIVLELGKLCYYTYIKEYSVPDNYFIVAPHGIGTSLSKLLRGKYEDLKKLVIQDWAKKIEKEITSTKDIKLEGDLLKHVQNFDFSIIKDVTVLRLLEIHRQTPYYHTRFPGGLPIRPVPDQPPSNISQREAVYIRKLLDAYGEYLNLQSCDFTHADGDPVLKKHLQKSRIQFYCAESLHKFSRDYLPPGEFERLQDSFFEGIENIIIAEHKNGFERVKSAIQESYKIQIDSHPLKERMDLPDRAGICHQLANSNRLKWTKNE